MPILRIVVAVVWLGLALWAQQSTARRVFAYAGAIVACVHVFALVLGLAVRRFQGGYDFSGFAAGIVVGIIMGVFVGKLAGQSTGLYWLSQIIAAGFLVYRPLFAF